MQKIMEKSNRPLLALNMRGGWMLVTGRKTTFQSLARRWYAVLTISFLQFSHSMVTVASFKSTDPCQFTPGPKRCKAVSLHLLQHAVAHGCFLWKPGREGAICFWSQPGLPWSCTPRLSARELLQRHIIQTAPHVSDGQCSREAELQILPSLPLLAWPYCQLKR